MLARRHILVRVEHRAVDPNLGKSHCKVAGSNPKRDNAQ